MFLCAEANAAQTIHIAAVDSDGTNTGTARLGITVSLKATVSAGQYSIVSWTLQGGGTLTHIGGTNNAEATYIAPQTMPANTKVSIVAQLSSNHSVTVTYPITLVNPVPGIVESNPKYLPAGVTTTVTLTGSGFVPGTVILANGTTMTSTYKSNTSIVAQIRVAAGIPGNVSLQARNPTPAGGTSAALQTPISLIQLAATDSDGKNTGTARLGVPVNLATTVTGSPYGVVSWTLQGAGALVSSGTNNANGTYTPPTSMPSNTGVTLVAYLHSSPGVTTTYHLTLVNPIPSVSSSTPAQLLTGGTQTVALVGSGFIPGTVVHVNGTSLTTVFTDYHHATVQVPVAANASGSLSLQFQNPTPGGGTGSTVTKNVDPTSITLAAAGASDGTTPLGGTVAMTANVAGSAQTAVNWSVSGAGSITSTGGYTAPSAMPSATLVTVLATLASNHAVTASYAFHLINPVPVIGSTAPQMVSPGDTTTVTLVGSGFVAGTVVTVSSGTIATTYQSPTTLVAHITLGSGASGNLAIQAQNPTPGGGAGPYFQQAISAPVAATAAARILDQTTFGPTTALIQHVEQEGVTAWLSEQFNTPATVLPAIPLNFPGYCPIAAFCAESEWWRTALTGNDQLRQRVAFALSEIFVTSIDNVTGQAIPTYHNNFANDAFGNWSTIMKDATLSPAMGVYLNMLNSAKAPAGQIANENFARENMQLFNMGLNLINQDGSIQPDGHGNPQPAYSQAQVQAFARVFTGWTYAWSDGSTPNSMIGTPNYWHPLVAVENYHDQTDKILLYGTHLPAGQTAEQDLDDALTNVLDHPNVPPFVCRQLIQHLVTGNPSPAYVSRVAAAFIDDGSGVRGDMKAVLTAIFTDPEARAGDTSATADGGHLREPILWLTAVMRGLGYTNIDPNDYYFELSATSGKLGEQPYAAPSVFNFFPPGYTIPDLGINSPEFAMENTGSVSGRLTLADSLVNNKIPSFNVDLSATSPLGQKASNPATLVDTLGLLFTHGQMNSNTRTAIIDNISAIHDPAQRVRVAAYLVTTSSEYKVMH